MWDVAGNVNTQAASSSQVSLPLTPSYLEDGVLIFLTGDVPGGMAPGDVETLPLNVYPMETWVLATVHLGDQPGFQANAAGVGAHGDVNDCRNLTCKERGKAIRKDEAWPQNTQHSQQASGHIPVCQISK